MDAKTLHILKQRIKHWPIGGMQNNIEPTDQQINEFSLQKKHRFAYHETMNKALAQLVL